MHDVKHFSRRIGTWVPSAIAWLFYVYMGVVLVFEVGEFMERQMYTGTPGYMGRQVVLGFEL